MTVILYLYLERNSRVDHSNNRLLRVAIFLRSGKEAVSMRSTSLPGMRPQRTRYFLFVFAFLPADVRWIGV